MSSKLINIALGKPAYAPGGKLAAAPTDGDVTTKHGSAVCVDLGRIYNIQGIRVLWKPRNILFRNIYISTNEAVNYRIGDRSNNWQGVGGESIYRGLRWYKGWTNVTNINKNCRWILCTTDDAWAGHLDVYEVEVYVAVIPATVDINPKTLNPRSRGKWMTCYVKLPDPYDVNDIKVDTIALNGLSAERAEVQDGALMVKFDRREVQRMASEVQKMVDVRSMELVVTGKVDGTAFEGSGTIRIIKPRKRKGRKK